EPVKELLRKLDACLAAGCCDIDLYPQRHSHLHPTADEYGEREAIVVRYPQRFPDAAHRQSLTDINVVVLQGADIDPKGGPLQQLRDSDRLHSLMWRMEPKSLRIRILREEIIECHLHIDPGRQRKRPASCNERVRRMPVKMLLQYSRNSRLAGQYSNCLKHPVLPGSRQIAKALKDS